MKLTSYTFTKEELWKIVEPYYKEAYLNKFEEIVKDNWVGVHGKNRPLQFWGICNEIESHIKVWCDRFSVQFFINNPDVSDVLVVSKITKDGIVIKEWIASR